MSAREKAIGPCRRCGSIGRLCDSHIIPEFAYRPIYDKDSRAMAVGSERPERRIKVQQGLKERLFCLSCEKFFNKLETPFKRFWGDPARFPAALNAPYVTVTGIDYENTTKFFFRSSGVPMSPTMKSCGLLILVRRQIESVTS